MRRPACAHVAAHSLTRWPTILTTVGVGDDGRPSGRSQACAGATWALPRRLLASCHLASNRSGYAPRPRSRRAACAEPDAVLFGK